MTIRIRTLSLAVCGLIGIGAATAALAQDFSPWTASEDGVDLVARTSAASAESGDIEWSFQVTRSSGGGAVTVDSLSFAFELRNHADEIGADYRRADGRAVKGPVTLTTDTGERFQSANATFRLVESNAVAIDMAFTPMSDDDGVIDADEPNCRLIQALRRSSSFTVTYSAPDGSVELFDFTGQGSSRALGTLGGC